MTTKSINSGSENSLEKEKESIDSQDNSEKVLNAEILEEEALLKEEDDSDSDISETETLLAEPDVDSIEPEEEEGALSTDEEDDSDISEAETLLTEPDIESTEAREELIALVDDLSPKEIVNKLKQYIIGQRQAIRKIAIALRDRRRRMKLDDWLRDEVTPKNILMIGPSGVGKTEIVRRAARITNCPFLKVEATKFTEVGYIGRDVDSIPRDLVDNAFKTLRKREIEKLEAHVEAAVEEKILNSLLPAPSAKSRQAMSELKNDEKSVMRNVFRRRLQEGLLEDKEIEIEISNQSVGIEIMGPPGMEEMTNQLQNMMQSLNTGRVRTHRMKVKEARKVLHQEEASKLLNEDDLKRRAVEWVEQYGIVFIDEIDKVCRRGEVGGADVSREGVQRDLLPLIEGSTVSTKYGMVRTDHILFITAGAFQAGQKPSDLIPELQGRLPIRVELNPLTAKDFERILRECYASLITQYKALLDTEGVTLAFTDEAIARIAEIAYLLNEKVENIGARRLYTVMERLLEDLSFEANDLSEKQVTVDADYVDRQLSELAADEGSSHYIL